MIEKLDDKRARLRISVGSGKNRKVYTKTTTYKSERDLEKQHDAFEYECKHNTVIRPKEQKTLDKINQAKIRTVSDIVDLYINTQKMLGLKDTTIRGYKVSQKRIDAHPIALMDASAVTKSDVKGFILYLTEKGKSGKAKQNEIKKEIKGLSPKTVKNTIGLLSAAYNSAIDDELLTYNPCVKAPLPKKKKTEICVLQKEDFASFLSVLDNELLDFKVACELALFCGLRRSEILGLQEKHINIPFKNVSIRQTRQCINDGMQIETTKTESSERVISIPDAICEDIQALINEHHNSPFKCSSFLIQNGFGQPMKHGYLTEHLHKVVKKNELPQVTPHELRHTCASTLLKEGYTMKEVSEFLGHSDVTTTMQYYIHLTEDSSRSKRAMAQSFNDIINNNATNVQQSDALAK